MSDALSSYSLRRARAPDSAFAERLYAASMAPLLGAVDAWDEAEGLAKFRQHFHLKDTRIIMVEGASAGFFQLVAAPDGFELRQLHLLPEYRNRGIGSRIIRRLQRQARRTRRPLWLMVVEGNPAIALYARLGFVATDAADHRLRMAWRPA